MPRADEVRARRVAAERHVGEMSKVLAVVRDAPETFLGTGWDTPINAGFVTKAAGDDRRLFNVVQKSFYIDEKSRDGEQHDGCQVNRKARR